MPAVLSAYVVAAAEPELQGVANLKRFLRNLATLYLRYNVIGHLDTTELERGVYAAAKNLRADGDFDVATDALRALAPPDEEFKERFATARVPKLGAARYILQQLEYASRPTEELAVAASDRVHVEHIYPRTPRAEMRLEDHDDVIDRLGNLALLDRGLNRRIGNLPFVEKRSSYAQSQFVTTRALAEYTDWTVESISGRQRAMADVAVSVWTFE